MSSTDVNGRAYARLDELKPGDMVELDDGFTCHDAGIVEVKADAAEPDDRLYFDCVDDNGRPQQHHLVGQLDDDGYLVGIYPVAKS